MDPCSTVYRCRNWRPDHVVWIRSRLARWWYAVESLLRKKLMAALLKVRTPRRISSASGEVTNRFRDDVGTVVRYLERYIHLGVTSSLPHLPLSGWHG